MNRVISIHLKELRFGSAMSEPPSKRIKITRDGAATETVEVRQEFSEDLIHRTIAKSVQLAPTATFKLQRDGVNVAEVFSALQDNVQYTVIPFETRAVSGDGLEQVATQNFEMPKLEQFTPETLLEVNGFQPLFLGCPGHFLVCAFCFLLSISAFGSFARTKL